MKVSLLGTNLSMVLGKNNKKLVLVILGVLVCLNAFAWFVVYDLNSHRFLEVVFFDVGQGDAIFIETPKRQQILLDGGPSPIILEKLAKEMPFYDRTIDLIILSHPEKDHSFGLLEVLKRYKIKNILWTGVVRDTPEWKEWKNLIVKEGAEIKIVKAGQKIILQEEPLILFNVLYPFENLEGQEFKNSNDTSILASLVFGESYFLFTGDISKKVESEIIIKDINLGADILKIAHHGSKTSSSQEFLEKVSSDIAVIQVGENNYGHPHPEVLEILEKNAIKILRTDLDGDIKIFSDGENLKVKTKNEKQQGKIKNRKIKIVFTF